MQSIVGFEFRPTDEELVSFYLRNKILGESSLVESIADVKIYDFDPWQLPAQSRIKSRDAAWYFFSDRGNRYGNSNKQSRTTASGYWKITGKPAEVKERSGNRRQIGIKKMLVFLKGKSPHGERTEWIMHEYSDVSFPEDQRSHVVCKVEYTGQEDPSRLQTSNATEICRNSDGASTSVGPTSSQFFCLSEDDTCQVFLESLTEDDWGYILN